MIVGRGRGQRCACSRSCTVMSSTTRRAAQDHLMAVARVFIGVLSRWSVKYAKALQLGRRGHALVHADKRERSCQLLLHQQRRPKLTRIGGAQGMARQQCVRSGPTASTSVTSSQWLAKASKRPSTSRRCVRDNDPSRVRRSIALTISVRVHTHVDDPVVFGQQLTHQAAGRFSNDQRHQRGSVQYLTAGHSDPRPMPLKRSPEAPAEARPE